tara:strand:- start:1126 stop:1236 length:111 start_codon:yes stop_codon:yes gene_type:complete
MINPTGKREIMMKEMGFVGLTLQKLLKIKIPLFGLQ